ncbi:MAG: aldo/keto reductase, partial [Pseudomonadota bacterium]
EEGRIRSIGICAERENLLKTASNPEIDVMMGTYNLLNTIHEDAFHTAKASGKSVVAIAPLAQAVWRRDLLFPRRPAHLWYLARALKNNPRETLAAQKARWLHQVEGWPPAALALAFQRLSGLVDVVMTTSTKEAHIIELAAAMKRPIDETIAQKLSKRLPSTA